MKILAFAVFDKKINAFMPPFFCRTEGEAIRSFSDAAQDSGHMFAKHAEDYTLFKVGAFDDNAGRLSMDTAGPVAIIEGLQCVKVVEPS